MHIRLLALLSLAACAAAEHPAATPGASGTPPSSGTPALQSAPGYTTARTGGPHDFDWIAGAWTTVQRRLKQRDVGSTEWDEFPATLCATLYLGGTITTDELVMPTKGWSGFTLRNFDLEKRQWSIFWVNSTRGKLEPPVFGGFDGNRGEFYGEDTDGKRPIVVRFIWTKIDQDHARWEQAFSYDGRSWETNWTADFTRADPATACTAGAGRPHV